MLKKEDISSSRKGSSLPYCRKDSIFSVEKNIRDERGNEEGVWSTDKK
jgi:hypothetical protein